MQRILSLVLLLLLPAGALGDGMVIPTVAFPAKITIPDQRALIQFTNDTERLVIETRFTGSGTNFAWVVPLPSRPLIEEASTGLFPTLDYLFRPQITHEVSPYFVGFLLLIGFVYLFRRAARAWGVLTVAIAILVLLFLAASLLPALVKGKAGGMNSASAGQAVSILDRRLVGIFETTTMSSRDPQALENWLRENGFTQPTNAEPVIASYVKDGWVFVAAKVRRDNAGLETNTPHPLSFTFKTDKPVYPMRLTGVDNGPLAVELYVFGPSRVEAPHFKVERCTRPSYLEAGSGNSWRWTPETPNIVHPLLRKWADGSPVATKLTATLSPADMRQDVWLDWTSYSQKKNHLFSRKGALTTALNFGTGVFAATLLAGCILAFVSKKARLLQLMGAAAVISLGVGSVIYVSLPKIEVRLVKEPRGTEEVNLFHLYESLLDTNQLSLARVRAEANRVLTVAPTNDGEWLRWAKSEGWKSWDNYLIGGQIHEEDSPGNYTIRENGGRLEFVTYDTQGGEHVQEIIRLGL